MEINQIANTKIVNKIEVDDGTGCWTWVGELNRNGYGRFWQNGARQMAHRVVYRLLVGNIGSKELDHLCCNRACVNPAHLEKVSGLENNRRRVKRMKANKKQESEK